MKSVLIYAGTTEGRTLAWKLAQEGIPSEVCVATEYGQQVMQAIDKDKTDKKNLIKVHQGRMLPEQMRALLEEGDYLAVVDGTHPFATVVTENVRKSIQGMDVPYFRLERDLQEPQNLEKMTRRRLCHFYASAKECAQALKTGDGNVLLTTGSKELALFCEDETIRKRLVVRVLPGKESMEACWENGLEGKQIIAMQGPFTKEMNLATIRQYSITSLVTKESGKIGGLDEKLEAALEAEIECHVIRKPARDAEDAYTFAEVYEALLKLAKQDDDFEKTSPDESRAGLRNAGKNKGQEETGREERSSSRFDVVLAGIGPGARELQTVALEKRLLESDYVFGAKRMIAGVTAKVKSFPYYLDKDVIPCLKRIGRESDGEVKVTILFSGDTGFYSGAEKLMQALQELEGAKVSILPGISSITALCAKLGENWQDAMIMSAHGTNKDAWKTEMPFGLRRGKKIFFLTSGPEDVREVGGLLQTYGFDQDYVIRLGHQLSYEDEKVSELTAKEAIKTEKPGLYAGILVKRCMPMEDGEEGRKVLSDAVTPGWKDEAFLRDKVPMTKEEVREISICKLGLTENAVAYDVGSGTGSIAMEVAALSPGIKVYAVECEKDAISLLKRNREYFGAFNVQVVEGMAPEVLYDLPAPTHVFVGGSKGNLKEILDAIRGKNPEARVVVNAVSLETIAKMQELIKEYPMRDVDVTTVSVSKAKKLGEYHLMQAANPVMIFSFTFEKGGE